MINFLQDWIDHCWVGRQVQRLASKVYYNIYYAGWPFGSFTRKWMPKNKVLVFDFVIAFEIYQCYFEDTITLFSFLLLGLTSQLIADRNAAYPTDPRCGISAAYLTYPSAGSRQGWHPCNPCNTSNCKCKCNNCKY